jgi:chemotaxis protein methyltransferase CheR
MALLINVAGKDLIISVEKTEPNALQGDCDGERPLPCVGSQVADADYATIANILRSTQSFDLDGYKVLTMKRRLAARVRAAGYIDLEAYIALLRQNDSEQKRLLAALSVHVSQFFRNPSAFALLGKEVLPVLFSQARKSRSKMRIWSVGCAYGEEAYTLALICEELLQRGDLLAIIATDLSPDALKVAKKGVFPQERLRAVSPELKDRWFIAEGESYRLSDRIRERVQFFRHDILKEQPFYRVDLILCRNLLIYFSREQQRQILERLAATLKPGGFLMLGRAETLPPVCRGLFSCIDPAERLYRRTDVFDVIVH